MTRPTYDRREFFKAIRLMNDYQVGDEFYLLRENKIVKGTLYRVVVTLCNRWSPPKYELGLDFGIDLAINGTITRVNRESLFRTKEEAADQFLKENNVPAELLKVLKQDKPKTTVGALIEKLSVVDPELDLTGVYNIVLKRITDVYVEQSEEFETTEAFWDCNCDTNYIHPAVHDYCPQCKAQKVNQPNSRIEEVESGKNYYFS